MKSILLQDRNILKVDAFASKSIGGGNKYKKSTRRTFIYGGKKVRFSRTVKNKHKYSLKNKCKTMHINK
jgi:hypothetical protein